MVRFIFLFYLFTATPLALENSAEQTSETEAKQQLVAKTLPTDGVVTHAEGLQVGTTKSAITYRVVGRIEWRTSRGLLRVQFGNDRKAFQLQGDLTELASCDFGDLIEISGTDIPSETMRASRVRFVEAYDGTKLNCESAYRGRSKILGRFVSYTGTVREVLESDGCCRLFMNNKVVVEIPKEMSEAELTSLIGTRVKVSGSSFRPPHIKNVNLPDFLYMGVLNPKVQIEVLEPQQKTMPPPESWLKWENATIDHVANRYLAIDGHGITTTLSQHLKIGDLVDVKALPLHDQRRSVRSVWLKQRGWQEPSAPTLIDGKRMTIDEYLHRRIAVAGTVENCFAGATGLELLISDSQRSYLVNMPFPKKSRQVDQYTRGVEVSLTGIVRSISARYNQLIRIDVAKAEDLVISATPMQFQSWLVKAIAAGILLTSCLMGFWYWALKRQVQRKTAELNTSTSRMMAASSAVRDGLLIFDADPRVRFVSDKVRSTMGISILPGDSQMSTRRQLESVISETDVFKHKWDSAFQNSKDTLEYEFSLQSSNRKILAFSAPVYDSMGQPDGRIWTFEDITERRKLEDETLQTRKLGAIGRLAGGVAHDFNNLLQVIGSNLELMQQSSTKDSEYAEEISVEPALAAVQRGSDLTRQLLTFARTSRVEIRPTSVNQLLDRTARMLNRTLGDHIRLSLSLTPTLPFAEIDSGQLEQAVINMCLNASEAIGLNDGFIRITTNTKDHEQIGASIMITIEDDGCGMSPEVLTHIFEPFFTTKHFDKGTGLGLATAFGAVERMHGRIECSSIIGEGTCFQIFLPVSQNTHVLTEPTSPSNTDLAIPRRILLVDDDTRVLDTVRRLLNGLGHDVICANGGAEGISILQHKQVELVILDLSMPGMTGWQVLQKIRKQHSHLKVIVCSGYSDDAGRMISSDVAPDAFLNKPFHLEQLSIALESVLN